MRGSLKRVVRTPAPGRPARAHRDGDGGGARARGSARAEALDARAPLVSLASWRTMVPLATAAALALLWGAATRGTQSATTEAHAGFGDDLLAELVAEHSQPLPPEAKDSGRGAGPRALRGRARCVRRASSGRGPAWSARRVVPLAVAARGHAPVRRRHRGRRAARQRARVRRAEDPDRRRRTSRRARSGPPRCASGARSGYSVAATQRGGVGYLVASDLDPDQSAQLAAMIYDDR